MKRSHIPNKGGAMLEQIFLCTIGTKILFCCSLLLHGYFSLWIDSIGINSTFSLLACSRCCSKSKWMPFFSTQLELVCCLLLAQFTLMETYGGFVNCGVPPISAKSVDTFSIETYGSGVPNVRQPR